MPQEHEAAPFVWTVRVYYEDTDAGGVVYYANYLRYLERARTEWLRALGFDQGELAAASGIAFAVRSLAIEYLRAARLDDTLQVECRVASLGRAQIRFAQRILRADEVLIEATVRVVCVELAAMKAAPIPAAIRDKLGPET